MVGNSASSILQQLQQKTRPMTFTPGVYDFTPGTVVSGISGDITGGYPRGMTTFNSGLEIQVSSTRRQTIRNMRFTRDDDPVNGRGLSIGPHVGLDLINCMCESGANADDNSIYGWPCRVRAFRCVFGSVSSLGHGFLVAPTSPTQPAPVGSTSFSAHDCEFRTAGVRNPQSIDAVVQLSQCKVWKSETTVAALTGTSLWVVNTKFYSTKHPAAIAQVFNWPGLIHIQTDWTLQSGAAISQIKPQVYLKNCTLDGRPAGRKDLCAGFNLVAANYSTCPDDSYFLPGSD